MNERKNVYKLPAGDKTLEWYSKAVIEMKKKPATDPLSWNYQAAMHGYEPALPLWKVVIPVPGQTERDTFWNQCQHGSWYFLPWHRMYLAYFEQIVAKTIVDLGGPPNWCLPFWDYSDATNPNARTIPAAFTDPKNATNGLWMAGRVSNTVREKDVRLTALNNKAYTGDGITARLGFGGPETTFSHRGGIHGDLEGSVHDNVHGDIGGAMGDPRTAGMDPIFWLHHANIDRLWQVWLNMGNRTNPTSASWLNFKFDFHDSKGNKAEMACTNVEDPTKVLSGYTYQDVAPSAPAAPLMERMTMSKKLELLPALEVTAATNQRVTLSSAKVTVHLPLTPPPRKFMNSAAFKESLNTSVEPKKTYLHFENITGKGVPPIHDVYLNIPDSGANKESYYAGSLSFFGVEEASIPSLHNSGSGQHYALDVSGLMNTLRSSPNWEEQKLDVSIEPIREMDKDASVTIGRISLYSE